MNNTRQDDAKTQTKCAKCGAWYETERKGYDFQEAFSCDCGNFMSFTVPAKPSSKVLKPQNEDVLAFGSDGDKLDTGMKAIEAIERARIWWQTTGRKEIKQQASRQSEQVGGTNNGAGAMFSDLDPNSANHLPSAIINGEPWDQLNKRERGQVVKVWHHFNVRVPDVLGEEQAEFKMQERGKIQ